MPRSDGVRRVDLDEHVLLQFGEPFVGARLLAAAFVFDQASRGEDQREILGDALVDSGLLHREADVGQAELLGVGQRRIFGDEIDARRVDRLAMHRDRVRQAERVHACLGVAVGHAAVLERHALDAARQIGRPGHRIGLVAADLLNHGQFVRGQIGVPAELLEHAIGELGIAVLDLGVLRIGALGEQVDAVALDAEARAERAAAVHDVEVRVVEQRRAGMLDLRLSPSTATAVRNNRPCTGRRLARSGDQIEILLVRHVQLETLRRLAAIAGRPAAAIHLAQDVFRHRTIAFDLDVLEHLVGEAELLRHQVDAPDSRPWTRRSA